MKISTSVAIKTIKEWGVDCDNFVAQNFKQTFIGGEANDNSISLSEYFLECLKIVTNLGLQCQAQQNNSAGANEKCRCFKFYKGQNRFKYCPDCGRKLR